jgi:ATP-dependent helicase HrpB
MEAWLAPFIPERASLSSLSQKVLHEALLATLSWPQRRDLDSLAPERLALPRGKSREIVYTEARSPEVHVKIQDVFGMRDTPGVGSRRVPAVLYLLSPAHRPVQVTQDLASFWKNGYQEVRKDLRGRYPKHRWPEDPSNDSE